MSGAVNKAQLFAALPPPWPEDLRRQVRAAVASQPSPKLVVLDDDPNRITKPRTMNSNLKRLNHAILLASIASLQAAEPPGWKWVVQDLTPFHDSARVLVNPHKGWYHHFPDNHPGKYQIARDADLLEFPGMDHLYIRLAWAYLEPKEGQFDWAVMDRLIGKWTAHGLGIAFRISCKETSTDRIEQQFATPLWVMEAGAKGGHYRMGKPTGPEGPWEPVYDDPTFLAKLDKFLAAFAERYDAKSWMRYMDIGSIGDWGEGHCWAGSRKDLSFAVRKLHVDLHLKHFKRTQLVISDDYVHALNDPAQRAKLHQYILANGISYRDDSIMVDGYFSGSSDRFTVRSPEFFADAYPQTPTVFELEHYAKVKSLGNWAVLPDSSAARFGKGMKGPDFFRGALELLHATYIGYHGDAREWLTDNPELTRELLNKCGYWLFPTSLELPDKLVAGAAVPLTLTMENRGVAPPYAPYELRVKLSGGSTNWVHVAGRAEKSWLPGKPIVLPLDLPLPAALQPGQYQLSIGLLDAAAAKERPVELALKESARDPGGYYRVGTVLVAAAEGLAANRGEKAPPLGFAKEGSVYVVCHKSGSDIRMDLSKQLGTFAVKWWNPRESDRGGLQDGSIARISGGDTRSLGNPPSDPGSSWAALVPRADGLDESMKQNRLPNLMAMALLATGNALQAADSTAPIAAPDLVFDEVDGLLAVEAEHFYKQSLTDKRAWPESGQRWQTVQKQEWAWDCRQRTGQVHTGVPMQFFLDIERAGEHEILFSMREDGFEMDKFVLAGNREFKPEGQGPAVKVKADRIAAPAHSAPAQDPSAQRRNRLEIPAVARPEAICFAYPAREDTALQTLGLRRGKLQGPYR
jgi:hypothetical protein